MPCDGERDPVYVDMVYIALQSTEPCRQSWRRPPGPNNITVETRTTFVDPFTFPGCIPDLTAQCGQWGWIDLTNPATMLYSIACDQCYSDPTVANVATDPGNPVLYYQRTPGSLCERFNETTCHWEAPAPAGSQCPLGPGELSSDFQDGPDCSCCVVCYPGFHWDAGTEACTLTSELNRDTAADYSVDLLELSDGTLVRAYRDDEGVGDAAGARVIVGTSRTAGATWTDVQVSADAGEDSVPTLCRTSQDHIFLLYHNASDATQVWWSEDTGASWTFQEDHVGLKYPRGIFDFLGRMVLAAWSTGSSSIRFYESLDFGDTLTLFSTPGINIQTLVGLIIDARGIMHVVYQSPTTGAVMHRYSIEGETPGVTWSAEAELVTLGTQPNLANGYGRGLLVYFAETPLPQVRYLDEVLGAVTTTPAEFPFSYGIGASGAWCGVVENRHGYAFVTGKESDFDVSLLYYRESPDAWQAPT